MKNLIYLVFVSVTAILQLTLLDYIKVFGVKPDLLLLSVIVMSLCLPLGWALPMSILAGIFKDASGSGPALNSLLFAAWSIFVFRLNKKINIEHAYLRMALVFVVVFLHNLIAGAVYVYAGSPFVLGIFLRILLLGAAYTALVSPAVFALHDRFLAQ